VDQIGISGRMDVRVYYVKNVAKYTTNPEAWCKNARKFWSLVSAYIEK